MTPAIRCSAGSLRRQKAADALLANTLWTERHTESARRGQEKSNVPAIQYNPIPQACTAETDGQIEGPLLQEQHL